MPKKQQIRELFHTHSARYSILMKMETLNRDTMYLKQKLNLNIDVGFVERGGRLGQTTKNRYDLRTFSENWKLGHRFICSRTLDELPPIGNKLPEIQVQNNWVL